LPVPSASIASAACAIALSRHGNIGPVGWPLVTAAIALWNTVYLSRALDVLRRQGETIADALLAHLAPVGWQHINLTGDYLRDADAGLGPDGFRLLRLAAIDLHPAVAA
jgi:hypothetical protein